MDMHTTWARERQERATAFAATIQCIAREWGGNWTANTRDLDGEPCDWYATLVRSDGLAIGAHRSDKFISFSPSLPRPKYGAIRLLRDVLPYEQRNEGRIEAKVSADRPVAVIARDIMRRVVMPYAKLFHFVLEHRQRQENAANAKASVIARITDAFPAFKPRNDSHTSQDSTTRLYRYGASNSEVRSVDVDSGGMVKLEVYSLTVEKALAVLAVLEPGK